MAENEIKYYWLERKKEREVLEQKKDEEALEILKKACEFYEKNYPKTFHGITYEREKEKVSKVALTGISRKEALSLRLILEYYRAEAEIPSMDEPKVGHAVYKVGKNIPDLANINTILTLEKEKQMIERKIHDLTTRKEVVAEEIKEKDVFVCHFCGKEFRGEDARQELMEHSRRCNKDPEERKPEPTISDPTPERLFKCNLCGVELSRVEMKEHATKCKGKEEVSKKEEVSEEENYFCEICNQDFKTKGGYYSHLKSKHIEQYREMKKNEQ